MDKVFQKDFSQGPEYAFAYPKIISDSRQVFVEQNCTKLYLFLLNLGPCVRH